MQAQGGRGGAAGLAGAGYLAGVVCAHEADLSGGSAEARARRLGSDIAQVDQQLPSAERVIEGHMFGYPMLGGLMGAVKAQESEAVVRGKIERSEVFVVAGGDVVGGHVVPPC